MAIQLRDTNPVRAKKARQIICDIPDGHSEAAHQNE